MLTVPATPERGGNVFAVCPVDGCRHFMKMSVGIHEFVVVNLMCKYVFSVCVLCGFALLMLIKVRVCVRDFCRRVISNMEKGQATSIGTCNFS